jgi:hypothetical protein
MKIVFNENINNSQLEHMFTNDDSCLAFLANLKWSNGFICRKCENDNSCDGKVPHSRRCTRCKNEESATANTLFHNIKFPVSKAFFITYEICRKDKNISVFDLAKTLEIRQMTCWNFKHKVENRIARLQNLTTSDSITMLDILLAQNDSPFI